MQSPARRAPRSGRGLPSGSGPGGVATLYPEEMKNKHSRKGKSRLRLLMAAAKIERYRWYLNSAGLHSTVACQQAALLGTGTCVMRQAGVQRVGVLIQAEA